MTLHKRQFSQENHEFTLCENFFLSQSKPGHILPVFLQFQPAWRCRESCAVDSTYSRPRFWQVPPTRGRARYCRLEKPESPIVGCPLIRRDHVSPDLFLIP